MCPSVPAPAACAAGSGARIPLELTGNTMAEADDFAPSCMARDGGRDVAFQFTAPETGRYDISTVGSSFDTVLSVRRDCGGAEIACNDDAERGRETGSSLTVDLAACETVILVVDGFSGGESGSVVLRVTSRESRCDDGVDNDGDGFSDYRYDNTGDPGCGSVVDANELDLLVECDDAVDNDIDGLIDVDDTGCANPADASEDTLAYQCDDGVDNDDDGFADYRTDGGGDAQCSSPTDATE